MEKLPLVILPVNTNGASSPSGTANTIGTMNQRHLTAVQQRAQQNLRAIWNAKKKELGLTQEIAADLLGWSSQGSVASYLNGRIPLNADAIWKFADLLQVDPRDIDPDYRYVVSATKKREAASVAERIPSALDQIEKDKTPPLPGHARQLIALIKEKAREGSLTKEHTTVLKSSLELMTGHSK